jgi:hypothetical protein
MILVDNILMDKEMNFGRMQKFLVEIKSIQQQFLYMQNSYPIVTFSFLYMEFARYHWLNVICVP